MNSQRIIDLKQAIQARHERVFEYEHRDEQGEQRRPVFGYLCEGCAQKKLAEWLQCAESPDYVHLGYQTDFDIATVFYEQKNDAETLVLTRWSPEQRRRRLQIAPEEGAHGNLANLMSARAVYRRCITHCRSEEIPS